MLEMLLCEEMKKNSLCREIQFFINEDLHYYPASPWLIQSARRFSILRPARLRSCISSVLSELQFDGLSRSRRPEAAVLPATFRKLGHPPPASNSSGNHTPL